MNQKYKIPVKKISLKEKLILYFLLLGIGAITLLSVFSFYSAREALLNRTFKQLTSLRTVKRNQIEQFFDDRTRDILFLARSPELKELLLQGGYYRAFYLLDPNGQVTDSIIFNADVSENHSSTHFPEVKALMSGCQAGEVRIMDEKTDPASGRPCMFMGTCLAGNREGKPKKDGILILELSIEAINTIMLNNDPESGLGLSGETYLVGPDFKMRSASRFLPNSILRTEVRTKPAIDALEGKDGCIITEDYRGIPVLSSFSKVQVPGLNWVILAEIDLKEAMIPVFEIRTRILFLSILIISIFFIFVFLISRKITKPLIRLKNAAIHVGHGKYDVTLPIETTDEIGALTEAFNQMALQIKENTRELQNERFGRMRSVIDGEEMERQRLSRELHDGIGQLLIAIKLRLEGLLYTDGKDMEPSIQELKRYFDTIIDEVRRISNNLMPSVLEAFGITIAFRNLFSDTEELSGVRIQFTSKGNFDDLDKKTKTYIYRLTQEALSNIVKHAEAKEVKVNLLREKETLTLVIRDNGKGFSIENAGKEGGNGIHNMRERVSLLQGTIDLKSIPAKGTIITITIPIIIPYVSNQDFPRG
jgi:signal transduction histidine kinase